MAYAAADSEVLLMLERRFRDKGTLSLSFQLPRP